MQKYFSVKKSVNIAGKTYMPCVCYPLTEYLKMTIEMLSRDGTAVIHDKKVAFQNGKMLSVGIDGKIIPESAKNKTNENAAPRMIFLGGESKKTRRKKKTVIEDAEEVEEVEEAAETDTPLEEGF